jgi:hypothetical protein
MTCPKCQAIVDDAAEECPRCGVVFVKLARREPPIVPPPAPSARTAVARPDPAEKAFRIARGLLIGGLALWTWQFASKPMGVAVADSVLHLPNLVFHEAGHVILGVFGRFAGVLGGSLFQFALPLALAAVFLRQGDPFGASVCTWWAGQNLLDVAPYIADARALQLVLLGGKTGAEVEGHDWEFLLTEMNLLHRDRTLGLAAHRIGLAIMIGALIWGAWAARRRPAHPL